MGPYIMLKKYRWRLVLFYASTPLADGFLYDMVIAELRVIKKNSLPITVTSTVR